MGDIGVAVFGIPGIQRLNNLQVIADISQGGKWWVISALPPYSLGTSVCMSFLECLAIMKTLLLISLEWDPTAKSGRLWSFIANVICRPESFVVSHSQRTVTVTFPSLVWLTGKSCQILQLYLPFPRFNTLAFLLFLERVTLLAQGLQHMLVPLSPRGP